MKTKRIKAERVLRSYEPFDAYILPADAESYERMVEQMAVAFYGEFQDATRWPRVAYSAQEPFRMSVRAALRAIGITPPKKGTNHAN